MFNFNSILKRSPDSKTPGKLGEFSELIDNQPDFWYAFLDAKNQFVQIKWALSGGKNIQELKELNKTFNYLPLKDYFKNKKQYLSDNLEFKDEYSALISEHDKLIDEIKEFNFHSVKELKHFLEQIDFLFKMTNLE
jgi:hypothetical protein